MGIPEQALRAYGMPPDAAVSGAGGTKNANFRVSGGGRTIFLRRRHPDYCDEGWIRFDHRALARLARNGVPVNAPLKTEQKSTYFQNGEDTYEAYPWVSGNPFPHTPQALRSLAEGLAVFHRAGAAFHETYAKGGYRRGEMDPERLARNLASSQGISGVGDDLAGAYLAQVRLGASRLGHEAYEGLPATLVHGDAQPGNAIFQGDRLSALVDVDWMSVQPVIYDLAYALILFCGQRAAPIDGADIWSLTGEFTFDEGASRAFLQAYLGLGAPFPPALRPALMEQVRLTWAHVRIDGARKVPAHDRPRFLGRDPAGPFEWIEERRKGDWF